MYGRRVRGPADMIADQYIGQQNTLKEASVVHEYAKNLQREITDSCKIASETAKNQLQSYREAKSDHRSGYEKRRSYKTMSRLNKITIFDAEPLPTLDELLGKMKGAKFFTKCDLTKGYWQIPMHEDSKAYTAFQTTQGLMEFNYMPFGLSKAACTFQRAMLDTLGKLPFVVSYFDGVLISSKSWKEHLEHIEKTLSALREAGFTVKPSKTIVGCEHINFLGHIIGKGQLKPDENKTEKIRNLRVPTTKKEVRSVLGLLNYYRRFVHNFSAIAQPLTELSKKSSPNKIVWTPECQESWDAIKKCLTSEPILKVPDPSKPFVVQTDASNKAIAATLLQQHEGTLHPCFYASRILKDRERNYAIIELEMLAIILPLINFQSTC
ncbi:reverse transcriptase [Plakobranchus ocellatus]|uniref:Reverse transcriptase n=1 Tax=Plakobranchus ocellatus TaxID=259542 RepID=A0AAV4BYZ4_9GAST|nr:reverse transcriptase [Plakobranchus ocellatus]